MILQFTSHTICIFKPRHPLFIALIQITGSFHVCLCRKYCSFRVLICPADGLHFSCIFSSSDGRKATSEPPRVPTDGHLIRNIGPWFPTWFQDASFSACCEMLSTIEGVTRINGVTTTRIALMPNAIYTCVTQILYATRLEQVQQPLVYSLPLLQGGNTHDRLIIFIDTELCRRQSREMVKRRWRNSSWMSSSYIIPRGVRKLCFLILRWLERLPRCLRWVRWTHLFYSARNVQNKAINL